MIGEAISGKRICDVIIEKSQPIIKTLEMLDTFGQWTDEIEQKQQNWETKQQRFGNQAFRTWHGRLKDESEKLLRTIIKKDTEVCNFFSWYVVPGRKRNCEMT